MSHGETYSLNHLEKSMNENICLTMTSDPPLDDHGQPFRIRSFIRRQGRMTVAQKKALEELWPRYGLSLNDQAMENAVVSKDIPIVLEIGFGNGESLLSMAEAHPECDYIGIEVHLPGVGHLLHRAGELNLQNLKVYADDAIDVLHEAIKDQSLDRVQLFFPDPWHKKRHHKRRIVNAEFLALLHQKIKPGGQFHAATDWEPYALEMADVLKAAPGFTPTTADGSPFSERPEYRPLTKFERRGQRLGHGVWDLIWSRQ